MDPQSSGYMLGSAVETPTVPVHGVHGVHYRAAIKDGGTWIA